MSLQYDVVIATLNRVQALTMSLPLLAKQTVRPAQVIIVDATDDHESIKKQILEIANGCGLKVNIVRSNRKNLPHQRNIGLQLVTSPIVLMPDDDSLLYPDTAELMLEVYAKDSEGRIGAVTARPVESSPEITGPILYTKNGFSKLKGRIQKYRNWFEHRYVPLPAQVYARTFWKTTTVPEFIDGKSYTLVETMGGYRMSFRSDVIKRVGFDETLGYGIGYATHEDIDASVRVMANGYLLAGARNARIFHNVFPSRRARGFNYGFAQIANYLLLARRTMSMESPAWKSIARHMRYKLFLYRINCLNAYNRSVYEGASIAWRHRSSLLNASSEQLDGEYRSLCDRFIEK